jgi:hypothetical protein
MRFSLRALILVVIVAGLIGMAVVLQRKSERLAAENGRLKEELGYLTVGDTSKIYARESGGLGYYARSWRVYLPPTQNGAVYFVRFKHTADPAFSFCWPMNAGQENTLYTEIVERATPGQVILTAKMGLNEWTRALQRPIKESLKLESSLFGERRASEQKEFAANTSIDLLGLRGEKQWPNALYVEIELLNAEQAKAEVERDK